MAPLDLSLFEPFFRGGENFEITEAEYEKGVKKKLPDVKYLQSRSPVARKAHENGYRLKVEERIQRVLIFTKMEEK